jgi:hypothetical protein
MLDYVFEMNEESRKEANKTNRAYWKQSSCTELTKNNNSNNSPIVIIFVFVVRTNEFHLVDFYVHVVNV